MFAVITFRLPVCACVSEPSVSGDAVGGRLVLTSCLFFLFLFFLLDVKTRRKIRRLVTSSKFSSKEKLKSIPRNGIFKT